MADNANTANENNLSTSDRLAAERTDLAGERTNLAETRTSLAEERTRLARRRTKYAKKRTHMAYLRTGISFVVAAISLFRILEADWEAWVCGAILVGASIYFFIQAYLTSRFHKRDT